MRWISRVVLRSAVLAVVCEGMTGCSEAPRVESIHSFATGPWVNLHAADQDLAGVVVQQFPDCPALMYEFEGKHPAMILYVFKDGRVNQQGFEPDGQLTEDFWWHAAADDLLWEKINRTSCP